jgi:hypothetical protein
VIRLVERRIHGLVKRDHGDEEEYTTTTTINNNNNNNNNNPKGLEKISANNAIKACNIFSTKNIGKVLKL